MKNCLEKIMNSESNQELEAFAFRFLENQGAALERNDSLRIRGRRWKGMTGDLKPSCLKICQGF